MKISAEASYRLWICIYSGKGHNMFPKGRNGKIIFGKAI